MENEEWKVTGMWGNNNYLSFIKNYNFRGDLGVAGIKVSLTYLYYQLLLKFKYFQ